LDLIIGYLRRVHLYAYYSGDKFERADQLERHHGKKEKTKKEKKMINLRDIQVLCN